jgi:uncharacterized membrane protein YdfJ with MMPL/SSD domain
LTVPLQAIVFNLLSVGATWGIIVLACIPFGLSMDCHVFILSRIREHYDTFHNNNESVPVGLKSTGKIITGAALIMVMIFGAFSTGSLLALQQVGFGLAVAVLLDATIVRSVLVSSVMTLLGDRNWWLPGRLNWLPDVRIEGERPMPAGAQQDDRVAVKTWSDVLRPHRRCVGTYGPQAHIAQRHTCCSTSI